MILAALSAELNDLFILSHALCAKLNDLSLHLHALSAKLDGKKPILKHGFSEGKFNMNVWDSSSA